MNKPVNKSAYLFLECMKYIVTHEEFTLTDLAVYLSKEQGISVSKATLLKHIRTMKIAGFCFKKINNKIYKLLSTPFDITLSKKDEAFMLECYKVLSNYYLIRNYNYVDTFKKLTKFISNDKVKKYLNKKTEVKSKIKTLGTYCSDKQRLSIEYLYNCTKFKNIVEPYDVIIEQNNIYLKCYNLNKKENILIEQNNIISIKQLPVKNQFTFNNNHVTLKMYGSFIKSYTLKSNEKIVYSNDKFSIVESYYQDKIRFFNNLLRYMEKCEILEPKALREEYKIYVTDLCKLYE